MQNAIPAPAELPHERNPFVPIAWPWRAAILAFVVIYRILIPGAQQIIHPGSTPLATERLLLDVLHEAVLFAPLLFYRKDWGWLHPLLFPPLFSIAKALISAPGQVLAPFALLETPPDPQLFHVALRQWAQHDIAMAMVKAKLMLILSLLTYYFAFFFGPRLAAPHVNHFTPRNVTGKALFLIGASTAVFLGFMQMRGGLGAHFASFGMGRFVSLGGLGHFTVIILVGTTAALIWYAVDPGATRNPWFWVSAVLMLPMSFLLTGSRSSMISTFILFLMIWMIRNQKVPTGRAMALGVASIFLIGILGALRDSTMQGEADWSILTNVDATEMVAAGQREMENRGETGALVPLVAKVPGRVDFLYGQSYLAAIFFFVPRAIWPEKPRGVGPMTNAYIYQDREMRPGELLAGAGMPPGALGEAYWNFYYPGVVLLFLLLGVFHRWLAAVLRRNPEVPAVWVMYALTLQMVPTSSLIVRWLQTIIPGIAILMWMGVLRRRSRTALRYAAA